MTISRTKVAHTPTPWAQNNERSLAIYATRMASRELIANAAQLSCDDDTDESAERSADEELANARFIVTACNAHQALYEALSAVTRQFEDVARNTVSGYQHGGAVIISGDVRQQCRAALKLAEEK